MIGLGTGVIWFVRHYDKWIYIWHRHQNADWCVVIVDVCALWSHCWFSLLYRVRVYMQGRPTHYGHASSSILQYVCSSVFLSYMLPTDIIARPNVLPHAYSFADSSMAPLLLGLAGGRARATVLSLCCIINVNWVSTCAKKWRRYSEAAHNLISYRTSVLRDLQGDYLNLPCTARRGAIHSGTDLSAVCCS